MKFYLSLFLLFFSTQVFAGYENLCRLLLTAHSENSSEIWPLWTKIEQSLRFKIRTGWIKRGIPEEIAETVLEHSQKVRQAALFYAVHYPEINTEYAGYMALVHDLAEAIAPDFTPHSKVSAETKHQIEKSVWDDLATKIPEVVFLRDMWMEYESGTTKTAQMVKQLDKLDAAVQAMKYEKLGYTSVTDFYAYTMKKLSDPTLVKIFEILLEKKFPHVNTYDQYFTLLKLNGDKEPFERMMSEKTQEVLRIRDEARGI